MSLAHVYPTILAGGSGTRFWPMSRERFPKQLLKIVGDETLIQQTFRRVLPSVPANRVLVITNPTQAELIKLQLGEWKDEIKENIFLEPEGRNTAPAIGLTALRLVKRDPKAIMLVLPADHVIRKDKQFKQAVTLGASLAQQGYLVTFGIPPTRPESGYGYVQPKRRKSLGCRGSLNGYPVARFVEKPDLSTAKRYLKQGNWFWNSGIFMWRASSILAEMAHFQPSLLRALQRYETKVRQGASFDRLAAAYRKLKSISIDYGVMERSDKAVVIPVAFSWSDVGSWGSLSEVVPADTQNNVTTGNVLAMESHDNILFGDQRLVAAIGLSEMVVVDTPDATLICPKSRSQDVKQLVEHLKRDALPEALEHLTVFRPWGSYSVLEEGQGYKVKRILVCPGNRLSLQVHQYRSEHWVVIRGTARVTRGENVFDLKAGESTFIPKRTQHRLENPGKHDLEIIEVQNGSYVGEDDIRRIQDDYDRTATSPLSTKKRTSI